VCHNGDLIVPKPPAAAAMIAAFDATVLVVDIGR